MTTTEKSRFPHCSAGLGPTPEIRGSRGEVVGSGGGMGGGGGGEGGGGELVKREADT